MKTSLWGWLILIAGSGVYFILNLVHLVRQLVTPQFLSWVWTHAFLWVDVQAVRFTLEAVQPLWRAVLLFLSVASSLW